MWTAFKGEALFKTEDPPLEGLEASGAQLVATARLVVKSGIGFAAERVRRQAEWILAQDADVASRFPVVLSVKSERNLTSVTMLRSDLVPLDRLMIDGSISAAAATSLMTKVLDWVEGTMHVHKEGAWAVASDYLVERVEQRLKSIPPEYCPIAGSLIWNEVVSVNGIEMEGLLAAVASSRQELAAIDLSTGDGEVFCNVHGDLHSGNILTDGTDFKLIDPRGGFDYNRTSFDPCYDFGKVFHDTECGYSLIKRGLLCLKHEDLSFELATTSPAAVSLFQSANEAIVHWLSGRERMRCRKARIYGALLLAGAVPFHLRFHGRALAMLAASLVRLNGGLPLSSCVRG